MKKSSANIDPILKTFGLEFVQIVQDYEITSSIHLSPDGEGGVQELRMPMIIQGFLMDVQDGFIYLSPDGENVNQMLPVSSLKNLEIIEIKDEALEALDQAEEPDNNTGYN